MRYGQTQSKNYEVSLFSEILAAYFVLHNLVWCPHRSQKVSEQNKKWGWHKAFPFYRKIGINKINKLTES